MFHSVFFLYTLKEKKIIIVTERENVIYNLEVKAKSNAKNNELKPTKETAKDRKEYIKNTFGEINESLNWGTVAKFAILKT